MTFLCSFDAPMVFLPNSRARVDEVGLLSGLHTKSMSEENSTCQSSISAALD
jgi:hypothetical protein